MNMKNSQKKHSKQMFFSQNDRFYIIYESDIACMHSSLSSDVLVGVVNLVESRITRF